MASEKLYTFLTSFGLSFSLYNQYVSLYGSDLSCPQISELEAPKLGLGNSDRSFADTEAVPGTPSEGRSIQDLQAGSPDKMNSTSPKFSLLGKVIMPGMFVKKLKNTNARAARSILSPTHGELAHLDSSTLLDVNKSPKSSFLQPVSPQYCPFSIFPLFDFLSAFQRETIFRQSSTNMRTQVKLFNHLLVNSSSCRLPQRITPQDKGINSPGCLRMTSVVATSSIDPKVLQFKLKPL